VPGAQVQLWASSCAPLTLQCSAAQHIPLPAWPAGGRGSATSSVMHVGRSGLLPAHQAVAVALALSGAAPWAQRGVRAEEPTTTMT
jgi:hypothetical protein